MEYISGKATEQHGSSRDLLQLRGNQSREQRRPLINLRGEVVGINEQIVSRSGVR